MQNQTYNVPLEQREKCLVSTVSLRETLRPLSLWILLAFFGVKWPQGTKQHEKRLSQLTCSSVPRNFSSGQEVGDLPVLLQDIVLSWY